MDLEVVVDELICELERGSPRRDGSLEGDPDAVPDWIWPYRETDVLLVNLRQGATSEDGEFPVRCEHIAVHRSGIDVDRHGGPRSESLGNVAVPKRPPGVVQRVVVSVTSR